MTTRRQWSGEELIALCRRKGKTYKVQLTELKCPEPFPGKDWIAAYFQYRGLDLGLASCRTGS